MQSTTLTTSSRNAIIGSNYHHYVNPTFLTANDSVWNGATVKVIGIDNNNKEFDLITLDETEQPTAAIFGSYQHIKISLVGGDSSTNVIVNFSYEGRI